MKEGKKPIYKKWWIWLVAVVLVIGIYGVATNVDRTAERNSNDEVEAAAEVEDTQDKTEEQEEPAQDEEQEEASEDNSSWDEVKNKENLVGKSDKDFTELDSRGPSDVRNDNTGNWRKTTITDNVDILEYALSYQDLHMNDKELHYIINFTLNTTTSLQVLNDLLYVDIKERVEKEEHDATTLGNGMLLKSYRIFPDGDIEEIE